MGVCILIGAASKRQSRCAPPLTIGLLPVGLLYHGLLTSLLRVWRQLVRERLMSASELLNGPRDQPIRSRAAPV